MEDEGSDKRVIWKMAVIITVWCVYVYICSREAIGFFRSVCRELGYTDAVVVCLLFANWEFSGGLPGFEKN